MRRRAPHAAPTVARATPWGLAMVLAASCLGCGAGAGAGGGADNLPTRAAGPYGKLEDDPETPVREPLVLADPDELASWRAPSARAAGQGLFEVYFAVQPMRPAAGPTGIYLARAVSLTTGAGAVTPVLSAERSWEATRVDHPQLIVPGLDAPFGLFYEAGDGVIGYAESDDGEWFVRPRDAPFLLAETPEEGDRVGAPAAVWTSETRLLLLYACPAPGAVFAAAVEVSREVSPEAPGHLTVTRLDGDPRSPERDPVLGPDPFLGTFDEAGVGSPWLQVTAYGERPVFDLYYSGWDPDGDQTVGFAGSHDGRYFQRFDKNPILPQGNPAERDPSVVLLGTRAVMFYTEVRVARLDAIGVATYP